MAASPGFTTRPRIIWVHDQIVKERGNAGLMAASWGRRHKGRHGLLRKTEAPIQRVCFLVTCQC